MAMNQDSASDYFKRISNALIDQGVHSPTLIIDKQRLDKNIEHFLSAKAKGFDLRIVAKSLPSIPMLRYIMEKVGSNRLMSFHLPFLRHLVTELPHSDILLGKPMPVDGAKVFYHWHAQQVNTEFSPSKQLHWLIDSNERLKQYQSLAKKLSQPINISLEIDVGLHRGGFDNLADFRQALDLIQSAPNLRLTGLMGYEAHITKVPKIIGGSKKALNQAMDKYQSFIDCVENVMGSQQLQAMVFNGGGSTTYPLYDNPNIINEIATASALVKPTDFDVFTLSHHLNAAFIATPILKMVNKPTLPMAPTLSAILRTIGALPKTACFIYGGNWLAQPYFPANAKRANILGHSSNQEMFELANADDTCMDDFFYFRPSQSEAVFLQFGELALFEQDKITQWWPVFEAQQRTTKSFT